MRYSQRLTDTGSSHEHLRLPKPDPANITVLTPNLPNKPILPWTHFDSPWLDNEVHESEESETQQPTDNTPESTESEPTANDQ